MTEESVSSGILDANMPVPETTFTPETTSLFVTPQYEPFDTSSIDTGSYIAADPGGDVTVSGQLNELLSKDNPYLTAARERSQAEMNARGLLNTTMAGSAGEQAAINAALPIATSDAGYYQTRGLAEQQAELQDTLGISSDIRIGELENLRAAANTQLAGTGALLQADQSVLQGSIESELARQQAVYENAQSASDAAMASVWDQYNLEALLSLDRDRLDVDKTVDFDSAIDTISGDYASSYLEIMVNPNFETPEDRSVALAALAETTVARYQLVGQVYGVELDWGTMVYTPPAVPEESQAEAESEARAAEEAAALVELGER